VKRLTPLKKNRPTGGIGRMLALLEAKVMIRTMIERFDKVTVAGPLEWSASTIAKGVRRMPVSVQRHHGNSGPVA